MKREQFNPLQAQKVAAAFAPPLRVEKSTPPKAVKFTPSGGSVTVATRALPGEIEIVVSDTGMGIPADELPRLFQRFFRTEGATSTAIPGTGLGLAIAKAIVTGHGGRVSVESTEGVGTAFRVILPG